MITLIKSIIYLATFTGNPVQESIDICALDLSHLNYKTQVEISIGCSEVNRSRYYPNWRLEELYEAK